MTSQPTSPEDGRSRRKQAKATGALDTQYGMMIEALDVFFKTRADDPDATERLRQRYCYTCRNTEGDDLDRRCLIRRCGLRDSRALLREQEFLFGSLTYIWGVPEAAHPEAITMLADWIAEAGCATVAFCRDDAGYYRQRIESGCLRAYMHAAIVGTLSYRAGDRVRFNLDSMTRTEAFSLVRHHFATWAAEKIARAASLRPYLSDNRLAALLQVTPKTLRDWHGPRENWPFPEKLPTDDVLKDGGK